jgi:predicted KAP-like P-loop ATPase
MESHQIEWGTLTPAQCRAARALLGWSQARLARQSGVATSTVADFERGQRSPVQNNLDAMKQSLEAAGVTLLPGGVIAGSANAGVKGVQPLAQSRPARPIYFNDDPITSPQDDRFGMNPFARALAQSFGEMQMPVGSTVAVNGVWGSGKSSVVNLIRHHLSPLQADGKFELVDFRCWWFHGEEALTIAFLQTLHAVLEKSLGQKAKELIPKIGKKLLQAGSVLGPAVDLATGGVGGTLIEKSLDFTRRYFSDNESVEGLFWRLSDALARQEKRFLVIIDDIDRLAPDEALLVFRLVKSVGRLPNVMYLLAFDRELVENTVRDKYPSEGPHFLEKIIQANFQVPSIPRDELQGALLAEIERLCWSTMDGAEEARFMNVFYDGVAPYLNTPRDLVRLTNAISVTWPPVKDEVNLADFVGLEAIRVFEPSLYNAIRSDKDRVCGIRSDYDRKSSESEIDRLLAGVPEKRRQHAKDAIKRLFPRLEDVGYGPGFTETWRARRLVCAREHFDTYFRLAIGDETLPANEVTELIAHSGDAAYVKNAFAQALNSVRRSGKSKVPLLFEELNAHAAKIDKADFQSLISAIFEIADDIDREADRERAFSIGDNHLRIHWLIRKLTFERCDLNQRSEIFWKACQTAQLGWLVDFTQSAIRDHFPREGHEPEPPEKCLIEKERVADLKAHTKKIIEDAAESGRLIAHPRLAYILYRWRDFIEDDGDAVKAWTDAQLTKDDSVALFARAFTGESWSQGMGMFGLGDRVAIRHVKAAVGGLDTIMDVQRFRRRLEELQSAGTLGETHGTYVSTLLEAWRKKDQGEDPDW